MVHQTSSVDTMVPNNTSQTCGRPVARWDDAIVKYTGGSWVDIAQESNWTALAQGFSEKLSWHFPFWGARLICRGSPYELHNP